MIYPKEEAREWFGVRGGTVRCGWEGFYGVSGLKQQRTGVVIARYLMYRSVVCVCGDRVVVLVGSLHGPRRMRRAFSHCILCVIFCALCVKLAHSIIQIRQRCVVLGICVGVKPKEALAPV